MAWDDYEIDNEGAYVFKDSLTGGIQRTAPIPYAVEVAGQIDAQKAAAPMAPEAMPAEPVVSAQTPMQSMQLAGGGDGASGPPADVPPPAAPADAGAGGASGSPYQAPPPPQGAGGAPADAGAAPAAAAPSAPPKIVRGANGQPDLSRMTPAEVSAYLHWQAAQQALRGSPGVYSPGGTFPTGSSVQSTPGPDPRETLRRERAERGVGAAQSDLAHVAMRRDQEIAETQAAEQQRAAERQARLADLQARQVAKLDEVMGEIDKKRTELAGATVDPNRYLNSMSTAGQVMAALAIGLGAAGKGLAGEAGPPMALQLLTDAIKGDVENQKYAIDKKRGDLNALGEVYKITKERFGDERMAEEAAYLAGADIFRAKVQRSIAEADAASGVETQYDENGQIIAGAPYSMKAKLLLAELDADQARRREALSAAANGQVAEQFVTVQPKVTGGSAPNYAKAAEESDKAAKSLGTDGQQVTFADQKYALGSFAEAGEGKQMREDLARIESAKRDTAKLQKYLVDNPVGSKTYDKSVVEGLMERVSSNVNVMLGQGAKNNDEAARWSKILGGVLTNGVGAVKDVEGWLNDQGQRRLDQMNARPITPGGGATPPKALTDVASGRVKPSGGGVVGLPPAQRGAPVSVVRGGAQKATPLDRAQATALQARPDEKGQIKAQEQKLLRASLRESLDRKQIDASEYKSALAMVEAGQTQELFEFLGRVRQTTSLASPSPAPAARSSLSPAAAMTLARIQREATAGMGGAPVVTTVTTTTKKGKR